MVFVIQKILFGVVCFALIIRLILEFNPDCFSGASSGTPHMKALGFLALIGTAVTMAWWLQISHFAKWHIWNRQKLLAGTPVDVKKPRLWVALIFHPTLATIIVYLMWTFFISAPMCGVS